MDPDANLAEQERLISEMATSDDTTDADIVLLAKLRYALSRWLQSGGFEPDWTAGPTARRFYKR